MTMIPQKFLRNLATNFGISDNEFEALSRAIEGESMDAIAQELGVSKDALQKRLGEVYKKFQIIGRGPGKLAKLQQILISEYQQQMANFSNRTDKKETEESAISVDTNPAINEVIPKETANTKTDLHIDWGEAPDVPIFSGRSAELSTLKQWIINDACRLVAVLGMGGIGKTALAVNVVQQIQNQFDIVIWRSLRYSPLSQDIFTDWLQLLSNQQDINLAEDIGKQIKQLIKYLRTSRCLLILDDVETIMLFGQLAGYYRSGYEDYGELIKQIGELQHNSCLLLISREKPLEIASLAGDTLPVRALQLSGLDSEDAKKIIKSSPGLYNLENELLSELVYLYGGNPSALKIAVKTIQELFAGDIQQFLEQGTVVIGDILGNILNQQFERIHDLENKLILWLALSSQALSALELQSELGFSVELSELITALESLLRRSLIEKTTEERVAKFTLQPVVRKYVTDKFKKKIYQIIADVETEPGSLEKNSNNSTSLLDIQVAKHLNKIGYQQYLDGEFKSAKFNLIWATKFNPNLEAAHYNLGATYEQLQDISNARNHYEIAAKFNNRAGYAAISNLTRLEIRSGNIDTAINLILSILPQVKDEMILAALQKNLGWAYFLQNRYDEAEVELLKSIELNNLHPPTYYILAEVKEAQGNIQEALVYYESFLKCDRSDKKPQGTHWRLPELDVWKITAQQRLNSANN